ncbi:MAG: hypothetical protein AB1779_02730 [Candidatus Thermoplasmatota archaeon]
MKETISNVEFFGIDFGLKKTEVCTKCGEEYITDEVMEEIENECRTLGLFGLERKVRITKSGNSLVIRIPPEIAKFVGLRYKSVVSMLPTGKGKLELHAI